MYFKHAALKSLPAKLLELTAAYVNMYRTLNKKLFLEKSAKLSLKS